MISKPLLFLEGLFFAVIFDAPFTGKKSVSFRFENAEHLRKRIKSYQINSYFCPNLPVMQNLTLLDGPKFQITIQRLCRQLIENHNDFSDSVILGIQPRGPFLANRIASELKNILPGTRIFSGDLDITFFRDDFRRRENPLVPNQTRIDFIIENKKVILIDDVLWTGRTIRAAMDAMLAFGRPQKVELLVLVDRRYSRHLPIEPDYIGIQVDSVASQKVIVSWKEADERDQVVLLSEK